MASPTATYNFPTQVRGDNFISKSFTVTENTVLQWILDGAQIRMFWRLNGVTKKTFVNGDGITVTLPNQFVIDTFEMDLPYGTYKYDLEITRPLQGRFTYLSGEIKLLEDITA
jgi:hypothetical protein